MKYKSTICLVLVAGVGVALAQFGSLNWGSPSNIGPPSRPHQSGGGGGGGGYGKPPRPFNGGGGPGGGGPRPGPDGPPPHQHPHPPRGDPYSDHIDPIPPLADSSDGSYDTQQLPAKLPILAPNGVVEIYNRVVDDLIRKLESDLIKKELDPMAVVIRPTPPGPVRVPGYLQKRPFRRPGAALYRSTNGGNGPIPPPPSSMMKKHKKTGRAGVLPPETRFGDARPSSDGGENGVRGAGKISKISDDGLEVDDEKEILEPETTPSTTGAPSTTISTASTTAESGGKEAAEPLPAIPSISSEERGSSEEDTFMKPRSDEFFPEPEEEEEEEPKKKEKKEESEEPEEEVEKEEAKPDVDSLIQHYQSKNSKTKDKYGGKKTQNSNKPVVTDPAEEQDQDGDGASSEKKEEEEEKVRKPVKERKGGAGGDKNKKKNPKEPESEEDDGEDDEDDEPGVRNDDGSDYHDHHPEAGTGGGKRPQGGYYPPAGPPALPAKPNGELSGLGRIRRASDVSVSVDARSAVITARLLVGPIHVVINDSVEPMEKNVKATIPELEAELLLMERHGVVFLQRFTLDRAYGQDVEISIPKSKKKEKKGGGNTQDPNHPVNVEARRQTKMAAHVSMEVVKLLRSGNLRVNLMRTAQGAMSKLKLPIKKAKKGKGGGGKIVGKKGKKDKKQRNSSSE